jgi:hypothetical protein
MPSLAAIFIIVTLKFPRIAACARSAFGSFVDVDVRRCLSAQSTLVQLLLKILVHSYALHRDKQLCPYLAANCQWFSSTFTPADTNKNLLLDIAYPRYKTLRNSHLYSALTLFKRSTTEPHSQHVTVRP